MKVHVVGAGLSGSEIAYQLAIRGLKVILHEMRPSKMTPVHKTSYFAELVCSNSLKSDSIKNASGLLKRELELFGSLILRVARNCAVPAGKALAVDREEFSKQVTHVIRESGIDIVIEELRYIPDSKEDIWIIATGPATSDSFASWLREKVGHNMYFFDAVSPIITADSINYSVVFRADRYGIGNQDYLNCPMNEYEYDRFYEALINAEVLPVKDFEKDLLFERCKPIEDIAKSGKRSLLFGPMKPTGIIDPRTGKQPFAVVQLRKENLDETLYNIVGFQTRLKWGEQRKIIRLIPGLEKAEIVRYGVMHKNIYINSRKVLDPFMRLKNDRKIFFAGQITGVEGYLESVASGLYVALNVYRISKNQEPLELPKSTMTGCLLNYILKGTDTTLQPMYANYGLMGPANKNREEVAKTALRDLENFLNYSQWKEGGIRENTVKGF